MPNRRRRQPAGDPRPGREELAFLLPFFGTLLLLPPLVDLFIGKRLLLFGLPLETLYLFAVWLLMIIGAMVLTWCRPFRDSLAAGDEPSFDEAERQRVGPDPTDGTGSSRGIDPGLPAGPRTLATTDPGRFDGVD